MRRRLSKVGSMEYGTVWVTVTVTVPRHNINERQKYHVICDLQGSQIHYDRALSKDPFGEFSLCQLKPNQRHRDGRKPLKHSEFPSF